MRWIQKSKARREIKLAYLSSPARTARLNLSTPQGWWGGYAPIWAHSTFHLEQLPPRDEAVQTAHEVMHVHYPQSKLAFEELDQVGACLRPSMAIRVRPTTNESIGEATIPAVYGPSRLVQCIRTCYATPGCGAVGFFFLQREAPKDRRKQGFCALKRRECVEQGRTRVGRCNWKSEWCVFRLLGRKPDTPPTRRWVPARVPAACRPAAATPVATVNATKWHSAELDGPAAASDDGSGRIFWRTEVVLGGGLNNMLMNVAQLLDFTCDAQTKGALVMPRFDADPLWTFNSNVTVQPERPRPLRFDQLFEWPSFQRRMAPCIVVLEPPRNARVEYTEPTRLTNTGWGSTAVVRTLERIYAAVRPSRLVQQLLDELKAAAAHHAGARWSAVHLPIETDWWFISGWCSSRKLEDHTRRCFAPAEAANLTATERRRLQSSGTVLLFALDKVNRRGPNLCFETFGERTVKLTLDGSIPYTFRNAAEQFLAAEAPAGFFGNSFSTFSKAVALLRDAQPDPRLRGASWAYDCALPDSAKRWFPKRRNDSIVVNHPGFTRLRTLPGNCKAAPAPPLSQRPMLVGVRSWGFSNPALDAEN